MGMAGDVMVDTVNIETVAVYVAPEAWSDIPNDVLEFLRRESERAGNPGTMSDIGYGEVPETAERADEPPTAEEQVEADAATAERVTREMVADIARSNHLRNAVHHMDSARKLEGFQTNHERHPRKRAAVDTKQAKELVKAGESLQRACAQCAFKKTCRLKGNPELWIDLHPYKNDNSGAHRPGSLPTQEVESRTKFLRELRKNPGVHCDPAKRK